MSSVGSQANNTRLAGKLGLIGIGMFAFGFALVPLYDVFCDITGLNGKVSVETAPNHEFIIDTNRVVTVEFLTSINRETALEFGSEVSKLKVVPGKYYTLNFWAENKTEDRLIAQAIPSIAPGIASKYFKKIECFCFLQQTFAAHEKKIMPVRFAIDPELPEKLHTVTLAYTFFDVTDDVIGEI